MYFLETPYNDLPSLPPGGVTLETERVLRRLITVRSELSELKQAVLRIPNPEILIRAIGLREAQSSSEIENLVTTSDKLFKADVDKNSAIDPVTKEVIRYRRALFHGFEKLKSGTLLTTRLFEEIVQIIRDTNEGIRKVPGVKIANQRTGEVIYTPPQGEEIIRRKLHELEQFIYMEDALDPLVCLALTHYQFEAIHPFSDGNGRTGRIINILFLVDRKLLDYPVLFLSGFILRNKETYYKGLREVTSKGNWENWIMYVLDAVSDAATDTMKKVNDICSHQDSIAAQIKEKAPKIYSHELVEAIFMNPYTKIAFLEELGIAKRQTAAKYLERLVKLDILSVVEAGRDKYFVNNKLVEILTRG
jgi:Fic family protein